MASSRRRTTGLAFTSTIGTALDERNVRREFYLLLKAQNQPRIRPHDLRHSFATILLATGEHPKVVQEMLGHSSVQLTLDTYSHLLPDLKLKERAAARLAGILTGAGENPGQSDQEVVSRGGIVPVRRARRAKPTRLNPSWRNHSEQR